MAIVLAAGEITPNSPITIEFPSPPHQSLNPV